MILLKFLTNSLTPATFKLVPMIIKQSGLSLKSAFKPCVNISSCG